MFLHFDADKSGYIDALSLRSCLESLGFLDSFALENGACAVGNVNKCQTVFDRVLNKIDPEKAGKIYLEDFLRVIKEENSNTFKSTEEIRQTFTEISNHAPNITADDLNQVIFAENSILVIFENTFSSANRILRDRCEQTISEIFFFHKSPNLFLTLGKSEFFSIRFTNLC